MTGSTRRGSWVGALVAAAAPAIVLLLSSRPFLRLPPRNDSQATLWLIAHASPLEWMTDPRIAAYQFVIFFEPGFAILHYPGLWLEPYFGNVAHHVAALAGAAWLGLVAALLVFDATRSLAASCATSALIVLSNPVWYCVADSIMVHYPYATAFALLALRPVWRGFWKVPSRDGPPDLASGAASALAFGAGLCFKESVAAVPALIAVLHFAAFRRPLAAGRFVVPHALVLAGFLAWRTHILGGAGGYFMMSGWAPANLITALPVLFYVVWGQAAVGLLLIGALAIARPLALGMAVIAWAIGIAPFALASPLTPDSFSAGRLLFPFVFAILLLGAATARRWPRQRGRMRWGIAAAAVALLLLQAAQRPLALDTFTRLPADPLPPGPLREPLAVVSQDWIGPAFRHQRQSEPRAPFVSYRTPVDRALDGALGNASAAGTRVVGSSGPSRAPALQPLPPGLGTVVFDDLGRAHLRLDESAVGRLWLALDYQNDTTRWLASHPVMRSRVDLPLARSIRRLVLFEPGPEPVWPAQSWDAPAFVDPWPPRAKR